MHTMTTVNHRNENYGLILGFLAISAFSVTLPATRLAVFHIDPVFVGLGRSLFIAFPALLLLYWIKAPLPKGKQWLSLLLISAGVVLGFPLLTSIAMQTTGGAQGGIVVSVLPLFTAIAGAIMTGQKPSPGFWVMAILGSTLVFIYLLLMGQGQLSQGSLILLGASVLCAIGYAEGAKLSRELGGIEVISWALIVSMPFSIAPVIYNWPENIQLIPWQAWGAFLYISIISQWFAFMAWYHGLALGGVVRVSQIQLLQPFLTLFVAAMLLGESITLLMLLFSAAVVFTVAVGKRMPVYN